MENTLIIFFSHCSTFCNQEKKLSGNNAPKLQQNPNKNISKYQICKLLSKKTLREVKLELQNFNKDSLVTFTVVASNAIIVTLAIRIIYFIMAAGNQATVTV